MDLLLPICRVGDYAERSVFLPLAALICTAPARHSFLAVIAR
jgi:hypothetical protein